MKKILAVLFGLSVALSACGKDDESKDASGNDVVADQGGDGGTGDLAGDLPPPDGTGEEGRPGEAGGGDALEDAGMPPEGPSEKLMEQFCLAFYCDESLSCADIPYGEGCLEECKAKQAEDPRFIERLFCAVGEDFCNLLGTCDPDEEPMREECQPFCANVEGCGLSAGFPWGYNGYDCMLICSKVLWFAGEEGAEGTQVACMTDKLATCDGPGVFDCAVPLAPPIVEKLCGESVAPECALVPDPFETAEACGEGPAAWTPGQALAAGKCSLMTQMLPLDCHDTLASCHDLPAEKTAGAEQYCQSLLAKCPSSMIVPFELLGGGIPSPPDWGAVWEVMGMLGVDLCGWLLSGAVAASPGLFLEFAAGTECVDKLAYCPSGDLSDLYCLLDIPADGKTACAKALELCSPADYAGSMAMECETAMAFYQAFAAEMLPQLTDCVGQAADCEAFLACFSKGE